MSDEGIVNILGRDPVPARLFPRSTPDAGPDAGRFTVTAFGTPEVLQVTIDALPLLSATVLTDTFHDGQVDVDVHEGAGFFEWAFPRQGYATIIGRA